MAPPRDELQHDDGSHIDVDSDQQSTRSLTDEAEEEDEVDSTPISAHQQISNVSFGALKQAQDTLSRKRKREQDTSIDQEAKLSALRERLQRIKQEKKQKQHTNAHTQPERDRRRENDLHPAAARATTTRTTTSAAGDDFDDESDASNSDEDDAGPAKHRSKHAPAVQSSKWQVTRKRQVIDVPKRTTRDPRFDAVRQNSHNTTGHEEKAYGFLREYQQSEMQELKRAIKASKSEEDKETLRRKLNSMENQAKAREAKEREREVVRQHRRQESEQVRQGKNPYFLKNSEIKQRVLVEQFQGMKGKDREKLLERRRRKESQKEKKRMPMPRRMPG